MIKNNFSNILWKMAKDEEAFLFNAPSATHVLVPYGKYSGLWSYSKKNKRCSWNPIFVAGLANTKTHAYGPIKGKVFPLPPIVYGWLGNAHPGRLHAANKKLLGWAVTSWSRFNDKKLVPMSVLYKQIEDLLGLDKINYTHIAGIQLAISFITPTFLKCLSENKQDLLDRLAFISSSLDFLKNIRPARRQKFISRCLAYGPYLAVKKTFPYCPAGYVASLCDKDGWKYPSGCAYAMLASKQYETSNDTFIALRHMAEGVGGRKLKRLNISFVDEANNSCTNT